MTAENNFLQGDRPFEDNIVNSSSLFNLEENSILPRDNSQETAFITSFNEEINTIANTEIEILENSEISVFANSISLDIDGNGELESSDFSLIDLYASFGNSAGLFDVFLQQNGDVLLGENATRTTGEQLTDYLVSNQDTLFDLDGNGTVETSDYSLLDLYGSFGANSSVLDIFLQQNGDVLLGENATLTTGEAIVNHLDQFLPGNSSGDTTAPVITADLISDTGSDSSDGVTNDPQVTGTVTDNVGVASFKASFGDADVDVTDLVQGDGSFTLNENKLAEINGNTSLADGDYTIDLVATDEAGNESTAAVKFTIDTTAPTTSLVNTPNPNDTSIQIVFNEAVTGDITQTGNYSLTIVGGENDGETIAIDSITEVNSTTVRLDLASALATGEYSLSIKGDIQDTAGNTIETQSLEIAVEPEPIEPLEISPFDGEKMVTLTRETIVRFGKKVDPETVTSENFYAIANGSKIPGRIVVSSTEEFATLFYDEPLPQSTEVRVVVKGDSILGRDGIFLDADADGTPGGEETADFRTLPVTQIEGTDVFGYIYDAYNTNPDGSNIPLEGVKITLDSLPDVTATTDENGYFILENVPAPEFYVYIDGSEVVGATEGTKYASLGKAFHSVPGEAVRLKMDGEEFNVYLPPMADSDIVELSPTEDTEVGFGAASLASLQENFPDIDPEVWARTQVTYPAGSAQNDDGEAATQAIIIPVSPDRLPAPLPPNVEPQLVISIQAGSDQGFNREVEGGATNFDVPAPLQFPNLEGLEPGEKSLVWSFNHDAGDWEIIGTGTVSEDGTVIKSDEGVGIEAPGWHFVQPGTPMGPPPPPPPCKPNPAKIKCLKRVTEDYALCVGVAVAGGLVFGAGLGAAIAIAGCTAKYALDVNRCDKDFANCLPGSAQSSAIATQFLSDLEVSIVGDSIGDQIAAISQQIIELIYPYAVAGETNLPEDVQAQVDQLAVQANELAGGDAIGYMNNLVVESELETQELEESAGNAPSYPVLYAAQIKSESGETFEVRGQTAADGQYTIIVPRNGSLEFVSFYDPQTDSYGVVTPNVSPNATYPLPRFSLVPVDDTFSDFDEDSVADVVEFVYGTSSNNIDTDNDGIDDGAEIEQGLDPLGGQGFPTGIISNLPLLGDAKAVTVEGSTDNTRQQTAYVATGSHGLAIVDASQFNDPIVLGQLNLTGDATDVAVDSNLGIAAVATNSGGLQLVDVSDPMLPTLIQSIDLNANKVEVSDGVAYATVGTSLKAIDILTGEEINAVTLPGSGTITDLATEGTQLYSYTSGSDIFAVTDISNPGSPTLLGQTNVSIASFSVGISAGNGVAFLAGSGLNTVDISDPTNPSSIQNAETFFTARDITLNGSGIGLVAAEGQGLAVYNTSNSEDTDDFLTRFDTPGYTYDAAIASGIAYVADGRGGLQVINYLGFDNQGVAPTVAISSDADLDAGVEGIQVLEGSAVPIGVDVSDDVQVRNVELLVNGEVVANDVSFPFDLSAIAIPADSEGTTVEVQVRATDTGGNTTLSNTLTLDTVPDTFAPEVTNTTPKADSRRRAIQGITVRFNEGIDPELVTLEGITLTNLGEDGVLGGDDDVNVTPQEVQVSESGRSLFILPPDETEFTPGNYQLRLDPTVISDRAGNAIESAFTLNFTKRSQSDPVGLNEVISDTIFPEDEDQIFTFTGEVGQRIYFDGISGDYRVDASLVSPSGVTLYSFQNVNGDRAPVTLIEDGTYQLVITTRSSETEDFSFQLLDVATNELSLDTLVEGTLDPGTSDRIFFFEATDGQKFYFDSLNSDFNDYYSVYGPGNQNIFNSYYDREFTADGSGTYVLAVRGFNNDDTTDYSFNLITPETTATQELTLGETVTGNLGEPGEENLYTFTGTAGQTIYFDGLSADSSIYAYLTSPSGQNISYSNYVGYDRDPVTLTENGTYTLRVDGSGEDIGNYSFRLLDTANATELTLDQLTTGTIADGTSTDLFSFTANAGEKFYLDGQGDFYNGSYTIYSPSNQYITGTSFGFDREFTAEGDGTYLMALQGSSDDSVDYSFNLITPDTTTTQDLTLGETVTGNISEAGEEDLYTFTGTVGQTIYFDGLSADSSIYAYLTSPSGRNVSYSNYVGYDRDPITLTESGTYTLRVDGSGEDTGDYSFRLLDTANATELTLDQLTTGTIADGTSTDLFSFTATAGQRFYLDGQGDFYNGSYQVYNPVKQSVASISFGFNREFTAETDGIYLFAAQGASNESIDYSFNLITPETTATQDLTIGETVTGNISEPGEEDLYTFTGTAGQKLYFDGISTDSNIYAYLTSPSGRNVSYSNYVGSDGNPVTLTESGTYNLRVDSNSEDIGDYSFRLLNLDSATEFDLAETVTGNLEPATSDVFKFEALAGQTLLLDGMGTQYGGTYQIYSSGDSSITSQSFGFNREFTIEHDGTYFLVAKSSSDEIQDYSFQITQLSFEEPTPIESTELTLGETVTGSIAVAEEEDIYTFTGTAGQNIYLDGISGNSSIYARIISPSGQNVNYTFQRVNNDSEPIVLTESGTYKVEIDGNSTTTGDYSFRVLDVADATNITLDELTTGTLDNGRKTDLLSFTANAGETFYLDGQAESFNGNYYIYSPGNQYFEGTNFSGDREFTVEADGTYLLVARGSSDAAVDYSFNLITPEITTEALTLGETVTGNIGELGEKDVYTFDGSTGQKLYFDGIDGNFRISARLIDPSGQNVNSFYHDVINDTDPLTLTESGTYTLEIDGDDNDEGIGDYSFRLLDTADATELTLDEVTSGTIPNGTNTDLFTFTATAGQTFYLDGQGDTYNGRYYIYNPVNQSVTSSYFGFDTEFTAEVEGTYVIAAEGNGTEAVNYSFNLITPEINTDTLTISETVTGNIGELGEKDFYTFTGNAGQTLYFDGLSGNSSIDARIISPSGQTLNYFYQNVNNDSAPLALTESGTYRIEVDGNSATIGDYSFRLLDTADATELTLDELTSGTITDGRSTDLFTFTATAGQQFYLDGQGTNSSGNYYIYSPSGQSVTNSNFLSDREFSVPVDGTYLFAARGNSDESVDYSFNLITSEVTATQDLTLGEVVTGNIAKAGEENLYTFTANVGQKLYFDGQMNEYGFRAYLTSPSGRAIFSPNLNQESNPVTLIESGTYQLRIDGNGITTGDYSFLISDTNQAPELSFNSTIANTLEANSSKVYKFMGTKDQNLSFEDLGSDSGGTFRLFGPGNQSITSRSFRSDFEVTLPGDGIYTLILDNSRTNAVTSSFRVV